MDPKSQTQRRRVDRGYPWPGALRRRTGSDGEQPLPEPPGPCSKLQDYFGGTWLLDIIVYSSRRPARSHHRQRCKTACLVQRDRAYYGCCARPGQPCPGRAVPRGIHHRGRRTSCYLWVMSGYAARLSDGASRGRWSRRRTRLTHSGISSFY